MLAEYSVDVVHVRQISALLGQPCASIYKSLYEQWGILRGLTQQILEI